VKSPTHLHSRALPPARSGALLSLSPRRAGWKHVGFAVQRIARGGTWRSRTGGFEVCLVLLGGLAAVRWSPDGPGAPVTLGPRPDVFSGYPHAVYLPPGTTFEVRAKQLTEIADCRAPASRRFPPREIGPEECGLEVRGGGNVTRQIVDILPPSAPADRLLVCEVFTPSGNWSSFPPHKHDRHAPPDEADLDETYYYRFSERDGYGLQGLYEPGDRSERLYRVRHGDLVLVRSGYHPFVAAPGSHAYYLNTLGGSIRSMAATDDPRYAFLRASWPPPDPRVPMIPRPAPRT
jgi:5-deoxy-glucuronate isomerase